MLAGYGCVKTQTNGGAGSMAVVAILVWRGVWWLSDFYK